MITTRSRSRIGTGANFRECARFLSLCSELLGIVIHRLLTLWSPSRYYAVPLCCLEIAGKRTLGNSSVALDHILLRVILCSPSRYNSKFGNWKLRLRRSAEERDPALPTPGIRTTICLDTFESYVCSTRRAALLRLLWCHTLTGTLSTVAQPSPWIQIAKGLYDANILPNIRLTSNISTSAEYQNSDTAGGLSSWNAQSLKTSSSGCAISSFLSSSSKFAISKPEKREKTRYRIR